MDRDDLAARTRRLADVNFTDLWSDAEVVAIVNEAYLSLAVAAPWSFLADEGTIAATVGVSDYPLPGTVDVPDDLTIETPTRRRLRKRPVEQLAWASSGRAAQAEPWGWGVVDDGTVRLFPTPDTSYSVKVRGWSPPTAMTLGGSSPVWDATHHVVVAYEAARQILESEGDDSGRAERYLSTVVWHLSRMAARYLPDGETVVWPPQISQGGEA